MRKYYLGTVRVDLISIIAVYAATNLFSTCVVVRSIVTTAAGPPIHTHACTYTCMHVHMHMHTYAYIYTNAHACTYINTHIIL